MTLSEFMALPLDEQEAFLAESERLGYELEAKDAEWRLQEELKDKALAEAYKNTKETEVVWLPAEFSQETWVLQGQAGITQEANPYIQPDQLGLQGVKGTDGSS